MERSDSLQRFFACLAEARDIHIEALSNVEFVLAIEAVNNFPYLRKIMRLHPGKRHLPEYLEKHCQFSEGHAPPNVKC